MDRLAARRPLSRTWRRAPRRAPAIAVVAALVLGLPACVGGTDPATEVTNVSAKLNAHGYTNDGPATWWWEYDTVESELGTANDTEVCGNPHEADRRCGPAQAGSQSNQVPLSVTVTGLAPDTTYYFRACGQDVNDANPTCAQVRSFETLTGSGYAFDRKWGSEGSANGQLLFPAKLGTSSSGNVYVADRGNHRVQRFSSSGAFITKWGSRGPGDGQFGGAGPTAVATPAAGNVYVADYGSPPAVEAGNFRIQKFSASGTFLTKWGSLGGGPSQFEGPSGVATDSAGSVYVTDYPLNGGVVNHRVKKFSSSGAFITQWGSFGSGDGQLAEPTSVATDSAGNVYVTDAHNYRVQKFSSTGAFITKWGSFGGGDGQFNFPCAVATDSAGSVYVADSGNNSVQKFSSTGAFVTSLGSPGSGDGQFSAPCGVAVDSLGNVYVADSANHRIQKFKPVE